VQPPELEARGAELTDLLGACVERGASVGFVLPFDRAAGEAMWRETAARPGTAVLGAFEASRLLGVVLLVRSPRQNGRQCASVQTLLVAPDARRRGLGRALLEGAEAEARRRGITLLLLDTETGGDAARLYRALGWIEAGVVPGYAARPDGRITPQTFFHKPLRA